MRKEVGWTCLLLTPLSLSRCLESRGPNDATIRYESAKGKGGNGERTTSSTTCKTSDLDIEDVIEILVDIHLGHFCHRYFPHLHIYLPTSFLCYFQHHHTTSC